MTTEQLFFLRVLSDYLHKRATNPITPINWETLSTYAANHEVTGILYKQCQAFMPTSVSLSQGFSSNLYYYSNRVKLFNEIADKLQENEIPFYTVKGLDVADLYPIPALRTMGDCDIVVHTADKERTHEVMIALGYNEVCHKGKEWKYNKKELLFEIHDHLLYDEVVNTRAHKDFTELAWAYTFGGEYHKQLDWNFHFIFLLLHLKKHLLHQGIGFRQFMDLAVVMEQVDLDWEWLRNRFDELQLTDFFNVCSALIYRWFDIPAPYMTIDDDFYESATAYVFANGVFGNDNDDNNDNHILNQITERHAPRWCERIKMVLRGLFPSYDSMRYIQYYHFVNNHPWLLPIAWIYRFYRAIRYRKYDNGKAMIGDALISDEKLDAREQELRMWGL